MSGKKHHQQQLLQQQQQEAAQASQGSGDSQDTFATIVRRFLDEYWNGTPRSLKLIDAYMFYILITGVIQFAYCCLVGTYPFNSFLSGFISCVASFVLASCLRMQVNPQNKAEFSNITRERAFADFLFANLLLHLVVINFIG